MKLSLEVYNAELVGLAWDFRVSPSSCGNPEHYSEYIRFSALSDKSLGMGFTHMLLDTDESGARHIAGYVSLRASSLVLSNGEKLHVNPAIELAELAVDERYERLGVGTELVHIAITIADMLRSNYLGIKYIVVCADPPAVEFYRRCGFELLSNTYQALHDGSNDNCVPMYMRFPE